MLEFGHFDDHVGKKRAQNGQKVACLLKKNFAKKGQRTKIQQKTVVF
jgi:hypothetical protein